MTALNFPSSPSDGDTFDNYIYDGTKAVWRIQPNIPDISSKFQVSATAPTNPVNGEVWLNSTDGNTYIYYVDGDSSQWIEIGGNTAPPPNISDLNDVEIYEALDGQALVYDSASDQWVNGEGSGSGNAASDSIQLNFNTISENYTFETGYNGVSAGPITIADGFTVTVPDGSAWSIV